MKYVRNYNHNKKQISILYFRVPFNFILIIIVSDLNWGNDYYVTNAINYIATINITGNE